MFEVSACVRDRRGETLQGKQTRRPGITFDIIVGPIYFSLLYFRQHICVSVSVLKKEDGVVGFVLSYTLSYNTKLYFLSGKSIKVKKNISNPQEPD